MLEVYWLNFEIILDLWQNTGLIPLQFASCEGNPKVVQLSRTDGRGRVPETTVTPLSGFV